MRGVLFFLAVAATIFFAWGGRVQCTDVSPQADDRLFAELDRVDRRLDGLEARREEIAKQLSGLQGGRPSGSMPPGACERLRVLYKFSQIGYATQLLCAMELYSVPEAMYLTGRLIESDHRLLAALRERGSGLSGRRERMGAVEAQIEAVEAEILSAKREKLALLDRMPRQGDLYAQYSTKIEESQKALESRAFSRKPIFDLRDKPFSTMQGLLPLPADGEILETFKAQATPRTILYKNGIVINAPEGGPVRAVHEGIVVFADWFKDYGKMMIISHGDHYYSLIAHAETLLRKVGETVRAGESIATVGSTGSLDGPKLYFEIRHYGKPVDPMAWLSVQKLSKE
ncbi:MAG: murein hydrolase activator EnvC family protein [Acidobacteriota bacterium]